MNRIAKFSDIPAFTSFIDVEDTQGRKGCRYVLDQLLTEKQRKYYGAFDNIVLSQCHYKWAPEIVHDVIILFDEER